MKRAALLPLFFWPFFLSAALANAAPAGPAPAPFEVTRLTDPLGDAFLLRSAKCQPSCPLVVVSHSRGMSAELSLTRPQLRDLFAKLTGAGYSVLVSNDAGATTWGSEEAIAYLAEMRARAIQLFPFNGRTYNFGYSMGGLPALLTAYQGVYPVSGVLLLDAQVNLLDVWHGPNPAFRQEVGAAQRLDEEAPLPAGRDPLHDYAGVTGSDLPLFVAGSSEDQTVSFAHNGEALFALSASPGSRLLRLSGAHLGASHFGDALLSGALAFLNGVERLEQLRQNADAPRRWGARPL